MRDLNRIKESKEAYRHHLASLPLDEKLELVERIRDRANSFPKAPPRESVAVASSQVQLTEERTTAAHTNLGVFGATASIAVAATTIINSATTAVVSGRPRQIG